MCPLACAFRLNILSATFAAPRVSVRLPHQMGASHFNKSLPVPSGTLPSALLAGARGRPRNLQAARTRCSSVLVGTELPALIYVAEHQGSAAADEFQKILDHSGVVVNEPLGALAHSPRLPAIGRHRQSDKCISRFLRPLERRRPRYSHHYRCRIRIREVEIIWTSSSRPSCVRAANV
jgi:hypothetical protein